MGGDMMPKEQYDYIKNIQDYMLEASNMNEQEAWDFGFRVWQFRGWLNAYMNKTESSERIRTIRKEIEQLCENCERLTEEELNEKALGLMAFGCSIGLSADSREILKLVHCGECKKRKKNKFCLEHMKYELDDRGYCSKGEKK